VVTDVASGRRFGIRPLRARRPKVLVAHESISAAVMPIAVGWRVDEDQQAFQGACRQFDGGGEPGRAGTNHDLPLVGHDRFAPPG
jgi:hypothetical protein